MGVGNCFTCHMICDVKLLGDINILESLHFSHNANQNVTKNDVIMMKLLHSMFSVTNYSLLLIVQASSKLAVRDHEW